MKENHGKYAGAIVIFRSDLRLSDTIIVRDMVTDAGTDATDQTTFITKPTTFLSRLYTYKNLIKHGKNILRLDSTNFKQMLSKEHFLQELSVGNLAIEETQFASSKLL